MLLLLQDPYKSVLVLGALTALWMVLSLVSTRFIVTGMGLEGS